MTCAARLGSPLGGRAAERGALVRREAGRDEAPVARGPQHRKFGRQLTASLCAVGALEALQHELRRRVTVARPRHRRDETRLPQQRPGERDLVRVHPVRQRLADDGAGVAVEARRVRVQLEHPRQPAPLIRGAVLQEVLHDVVPVGVLRERDGVADEVLDEPLHLLRRAVLDEPLDDAAAVAVACRLGGAVGPAAQQLVDDELRGLRAYRDDALLQDVVRMWAAQGLPDVAAKLPRQGGPGLVAPRRLEGLLDLATAARVPREGPDASGHVRPRPGADGVDEERALLGHAARVDSAAVSAVAREVARLRLALVARCPWRPGEPGGQIGGPGWQLRRGREAHPDRPGREVRQPGGAEHDGHRAGEEDAYGLLLLDLVGPASEGLSAG